jgi:small conductance mechanosensitive channel
MNLSVNIEQTIETLIKYVSVYGLSVLGALLILIFGYIGAKIAKGLITGTMTRAKLDTILISFGANATYAVLIVFVFISALNQLGFQTTSLAAILGAAGLAIALAFKDSLSNLASGIMVIIFRPFKIGDFIETSSGEGTVNDINIFTTVLKTSDNKRLIVPNSALTANSITNYTAEKTRRVDLIVGISYDADIKKAKQLLEKILKTEKRVLETPAPVIAVHELADNSVNFVVRPWVKTEEYWPTRWAILETVKLTFDKENIGIPYPQQDIYIKELPAGVKTAKK